MTTPKPARITRILLPLSLALNLLVLGLVAGALLRGPSGAPRAMDLSLGPLTRALSDADRDALNTGLRRDLRDGRFAPVQGADARAGELRGLLDALRADPFDAQEFADHLERQRARAEDWARAGQAALIARVTAMTPEERGRFADRLEEEFQSREHLPPRRGGHDRH